MREGDIDGKAYHFVGEGAFESMVESRQFLEYANVFGNYYGTSIAAIENCTSQGKDVILEIDWQGAEQARETLDSTVSVFILPPSREILERRLRERGTDADDVIARRTQEAVEEMQHYDKADFLLINDHFEATLSEFRAIIISQRAVLRRRRRQYAELIESLIAK